MKRFLFIFLCLPSLIGAQNSYEQATLYFQQEAFQMAKPIFEAALRQDPTNQITREYLGDIASYRKDWDSAIEFYEGLVEYDDTSANYHFKYGGALGMKALSINRLRAVSYIGEIKAHFEKAAMLDPEHIDVRWALVEFYIQLPGIIGGSERKAIKFANELGEISQVDGHLSNGYIAEYSGRENDAEMFYKRAIAVGGSPHTYTKLANHYEKINKPKEAIETASKSLQIHKRNKLNYQIGKIAAEYNLDAEWGINCLQAYIKNHTVKDGVPKDWAYFRLAQIYKNLGEKEPALTWINKALTQRPDFEEAQKERKLIESL
ncbi:MAG: tetratricopeptide (TPR) repeat protein [Candidatus Latescibacterota bacterium]|jgi:tetratricopeptide (TPR) repeat protein